MSLTTAFDAQYRMGPTYDRADGIQLGNAICSTVATDPRHQIDSDELSLATLPPRPSNVSFRDVLTLEFLFAPAYTPVMKHIEIFTALSLLCMKHPVDFIIRGTVHTCIVAAYVEVVTKNTMRMIIDEYFENSAKFVFTAVGGDEPPHVVRGLPYDTSYYRKIEDFHQSFMGGFPAALKTQPLFKKVWTCKTFKNYGFYHILIAIRNDNQDICFECLMNYLVLYCKNEFMKNCYNYIRLDTECCEKTDATSLFHSSIYAALWQGYLFHTQFLFNETPLYHKLLHTFQRAIIVDPFFVRTLYGHEKLFESRLLACAMKPRDTAPLPQDKRVSRLQLFATIMRETLGLDPTDVVHFTTFHLIMQRLIRDHDLDINAYYLPYITLCTRQDSIWVFFTAEDRTVIAWA